MSTSQVVNTSESSEPEWYKTNTAEEVAKGVWMLQFTRAENVTGAKCMHLFPVLIESAERRCQPLGTASNQSGFRKAVHL
jgi:hypothetical protein